MVKRPPLGRLHVLTDEALQSRFSHRELARLALAGGADTVQFREKRPRTARELLRAAAGIAEECRAAAALFVVDDRADICAAVDADGIHLGRDDLPATVARRLLGPTVLVGGTANSLEELLAVSAGPVDYIGAGPVFGTTSKAGPAPMLGLEGLRAIVAACHKPVIAIGAITADRAVDVMATGAYGIAVLSGVVCQPDPTAAAARYRAAIDAFLAATARKEAPHA